MKRTFLTLVMVVVVTAVALLFVARLRRSASTGGAPLPGDVVQSPPRSLSSEAKQALDAAAALTEKGYDFKQEGKNREALTAFEEARAALLPQESVLRTEVASNLDDQATVYLRTGSYDRARKLYEEALTLLKTEGGDGERLSQSIDRRLATLNALEAHGIVCAEPLTPAGEDDDGSKALPDASPSTDATVPYFPELQDMYDGFAKLQGDLRDCVDESLRFSPISVWMVVTGDGQVILSSAKHGMKGTPAGDCLEKRLEKVAAKHRGDLPRFRACFRSFTYPFLFGK